MSKQRQWGREADESRKLPTSLWIVSELFFGADKYQQPVDKTSNAG